MALIGLERQVCLICRRKEGEEEKERKMVKERKTLKPGNSERPWKQR
jgi:hypothetical protein